MQEKIIHTDSINSYSFVNNNNEKNLNEIIFHTFATDSFLKWLYVSFYSIDLSYGFGIKKIVQTLNSEKYQDLIHKFSNNCEIFNLNLTNDHIAKKINLPINKIEKYKDELKYGSTTEDNFKLKLFISVQLRYLSLKDTFDKISQNKNFKYLIHSDVDVNHRSDLLSKIKKYSFDIALFGRSFLTSMNQPLGAYIILGNTKKTKNFLEKWGQNINSIDFENWQRGYGQITLRDTLINMVKTNEIELFDLSSIQEVKFSKLSEKDADIWLNSNSKHEGSAFDTPFLNSISDISERIHLLSQSLEKI